MPIRNSGDCGTVWASVETGCAPQARSGSTENRVQRAQTQACSGAGQVDAEGAALAHAAVDGHASAVRLGDVFDDRQPQARAAEVTAAGLVDAVEPVSYTHLTLPTIYSV